MHYKVSNFHIINKDNIVAFADVILDNLWITKGWVLRIRSDTGELWVSKPSKYNRRMNRYFDQVSSTVIGEEEIVKQLIIDKYKETIGADE